MITLLLLLEQRYGPKSVKYGLVLCWAFEQMNEYLDFIQLNKLLGAAEIISATIIDFLYENFIIILIYDHFIFSYLLQCVYSFKNETDQ